MRWDVRGVEEGMESKEMGLYSVGWEDLESKEREQRRNWDVVSWCIVN